jgi:hypothetical protein
VERPETKKRNYGEKVDHDLAPYQLVEAFPDIEKLLWEHGINNLKSAFSWLRHRYVLVHSYHCILRCESIFKGELSDCLMVKFFFLFMACLGCLGSTWVSVGRCMAKELESSTKNVLDRDHNIIFFSPEPTVTGEVSS